jgi:hypothetical protein
MSRHTADPDDRRPISAARRASRPGLSLAYDTATPRRVDHSVARRSGSSRTRPQGPGLPGGRLRATDHRPIGELPSGALEVWQVSCERRPARPPGETSRTGRTTGTPSVWAGLGCRPLARHPRRSVAERLRDGEAEPPSRRRPSPGSHRRLIGLSPSSATPACTGRRLPS